MKKQLLGILLLALGMALIFLIMSCAPTPQNTNQALNANASDREVQPSKPCTVASVNSDANLMVNAAKLKDQKDGTGNQYGNKNFDYRVVEIGNPAVKVLLIQGAISDGKGGPNSNKNAEHMEKFIKEIDQLITKDCVDKAVFVPRGTFAALDRGSLRPEDVAGFEWSTCEWPNMPCAGGVCAENCPGIASNIAASGNANSTNSTTNSRPNSNGNSNPNTNTNTNTNRAP